MSEHVTLTTKDGHSLDAYVARPEGEPIAGLVVVQELFGVNAHIRAVADGYARDGFLAVAPALFDRYERGVELGYQGPDLQRAMSFLPKLNMDWAVNDTGAALAYARGETGKRTGVIGYCWGGTIAWLAATRLGADAAVGYYGGRIGMFAEERPQAPVQLHFGEKDDHIPKSEIDHLQALHPEVEIHWYHAGHGFNCDLRGSYEPASAALARERALAFLKAHLAG